MSRAAEILPASQYESIIHVGPYDGLIGAVDNLLQWADARDLDWDKSIPDDDELWGCRLEIYSTDPQPAAPTDQVGEAAGVPAEVAVRE